MNFGDGRTTLLLGTALYYGDGDGDGRGDAGHSGTWEDLSVMFEYTTEYWYTPRERPIKYQYGYY